MIQISQDDYDDLLKINEELNNALELMNVEYAELSSVYCILQSNIIINKCQPNILELYESLLEQHSVLKMEATAERELHLIVMDEIHTTHQFEVGGLMNEITELKTQLRNLK